MILSDEGIRRALSDGRIEIEPPPEKDHYSPSAVDILLGGASTFRRWRLEALTAPGVQVVLNLAEQNYVTTAHHWAESVTPEPDGSIHPPAIRCGATTAVVPNSSAPSPKAGVEARSTSRRT